MALAARTVAAIQQRLRPSASAEFINACNSLNTTLSKDCRLQLQSRMTRPCVAMLIDLIGAASKGSVPIQAAQGQDAVLIRAFAQWLGDIGAANDLLTTIATVT